MDRYGTKITDGVLYINGPDGWIVVGPFEEIIDELGETYEIEYEEPAASMPWLDTEDGVLTIDVRERVPDLDFREEFVQLLADTPENQRLEFYTNMLQEIMDSKGDLES